MKKAILGTFYVDGKKIRRPVFLEERKCDECNKWFEPKRINSKYCSRECGQISERKRNYERILKNAKKWYQANKEKAKKRRREYYWKDPEKWLGKSREYRENNSEHVHKINQECKDVARFGGLRKKVFEATGYCEMCNSIANLLVHHKDGDNTNNEMSNLVVLCRSCHLKTHDPLFFRWGHPTFKENYHD